MNIKPIKSLLIAFICLFTCNSLFAQKFEGLAQTPPMGWNSWNTFQTNIDEPLLKGMVPRHLCLPRG